MAATRQLLCSVHVWIVAIAVLSGCRPASPTGPARAEPREPVKAIIEAFRTHDIVALGDSHGNEQVHAVRSRLVQDPRFGEVVDDIVVEFGNARYQELIDRFVRGEIISDSALRQVWQDTTQAHPVWDVPVYEGFFRAVRDANASQPTRRPIRILLGDVPFDWDSVQTTEEWRKQRESKGTLDAHALAVIQREVIARQHRALLILGNMHFVRRDPFGASDSAESIVAGLERVAPRRVFTVWTHTGDSDLTTLQESVATWSVPSLTVLHGSMLGAADFAFYYPHESFINNRAVKVAPGLRMEDEFDALLYLGPHSSITSSELPPRLCKDGAYTKMRFARMAVLPRFPGGGDPAEPLREYCRLALSR
jgi:hypothetical protein